MEEPLKYILLFLPILAGAIAIFFSFKLMRGYKPSFISSYFYYLVFLYIFGVYSLVGSGILEQLFISMEVDRDTIQSSKLIAILVGIPLLVLSKYMLLRSFSEMLSKKLRLSFTIGYFLVATISFVIYGVFVVRITRFGIGDYQAMIEIQQWVFTGLMVAVYLAAFLMSLVLSRQMAKHDRQFALVFASWYLLYMVFSCVPFILIKMHEILPFIFIFFFLSWHLIPILFLNLYLAKYHSQNSTVQDDFETLLVSFAEKFDISKREREVVRLISKGLSNQEISDSLYISLQTVKDHIHRIFNKTGVKNRIQLTNLIRSD
jgi:DNA-binding CsgD family transcriptional regulator